MELYIYENYRDIYPGQSGQSLTDQLIRDAAEDYGIENPRVLRADGGKPYLAGNPVFLSVSHSGAYFVCLFDQLPVGIDVQQERRVKAAVAQRYFTEKENLWMQKQGESGFFRLWTRKEAYAKFLGSGLSEILKGTSVLGREDVEFTEFQLEKGVYCACCRKKKI